MFKKLNGSLHVLSPNDQKNKALADVHEHASCQSYKLFPPETADSTELDTLPEHPPDKIDFLRSLIPTSLVWDPM